MAQVATETIELPDHQGVALAQGFGAGEQAEPVVAASGGKVLVKAPIRHAGSEQGVALQVEHLGAVSLGHPHVAEEHVPQTSGYVTTTPYPRS